MSGLRGCRTCWRLVWGPGTQPWTGGPSPDGVSVMDGAEPGSLPHLVVVDTGLRENVRGPAGRSHKVWPGLACAEPASWVLVDLGELFHVLVSCHTHGGWASETVREASPGGKHFSSLSGIARAVCLSGSL